MAILGNIIARSLHIRKAFSRNRAKPEKYQHITLRKLLETAQYTAFGKAYDFEGLLNSTTPIEQSFREHIPIFDYSKMHKEWWYRLLEGEENISWPGKVKYFALSSGTSEAASKYIPVTNDMIKSVKNVAFKQFFSLTNFELPAQTFSKGVLMLGGTTALQEHDGFFTGDMSGISAKKIPRLLSNIYYKPGQKISKKTEWEDRIDMIVENARNWDVGTVCGIPSWVQIVFERIFEKYKVQSIHEIWPNLKVYIHGGVAFEPYREWFNNASSQPITYIETYMASEGSFGFKKRPNAKGIGLVLNAGIFFEFLPFTSENFDVDGNIINPHPKTFLVHEVKPKVHYAVLLSTCSGAWRYMIGDVVQFTNVSQSEIVIVGRTKQFLSICGEHVSVDNLNAAIEKAIHEHQFELRDFTVAGYRDETDNTFIHHWFIASDDKDLALDAIRDTIDTEMCQLNDDYAVERKSALKKVLLTVIPSTFIDEYMKEQGRYGAMNKFPKVMKGDQQKAWFKFLKSQKSVAVQGLN